jgi:hypothetical protein
MSNLRPQIRSIIHEFLSTQDGYHQRADVLRVLEEEAMLLKETESIRDRFDLDPLELLDDTNKGAMDEFKTRFHVTSCNRVVAGHDYCAIDAVVTFDSIEQPSKKNKKNNRKDKEDMQLTFRYERKLPDRNDVEKMGCHIWYSIQISKGYQKKENLLVVQVWAPMTYPSAGTAICINEERDVDENANDDDDDDEEEDGWEDMDDDDEIPDHLLDTSRTTSGSSTTKPSPVENEPSTTSLVTLSEKSQSGGRTTNHDPKQEIGTKRRKVDISHPVGTKKQPSKGGKSRTREESDATDEDDNDSSTTERVDLYSVDLDGDLLHDFLDCTGLEPMPEDKAFFLLMTFPFYEQEWDLIGYVLDEVFGMDDEEGDHDNNDDDHER